MRVAILVTGLVALSAAVASAETYLVRMETESSVEARKVLLLR